MIEISSNKDLSRLEINNYNGNSGEKIRHSLALKRFPKELNFFREKDNHSYVGGEIIYKGKCENNLIISPYKINFLRNVKNSLIIVDTNKIEVSPISKSLNLFEENEKLLLGNINYHIPKRVFMIFEKMGGVKR